MSAGFTALQLVQKVLQLPTGGKEIELKEIRNLYNRVARRLFMLNVKYSMSQTQIMCILPLLQIPGIPHTNWGLWLAFLGLITAHNLARKLNPYRPL